MPGDVGGCGASGPQSLRAGDEESGFWMGCLLIAEPPQLLQVLFGCGPRLLPSVHISTSSVITGGGLKTCGAPALPRNNTFKQVSVFVFPLSDRDVFVSKLTEIRRQLAPLPSNVTFKLNLRASPS